jgi:hypothetical protein
MLAKEKGWTRDLAGAVGSRARDMRQHSLSDTAFRKRAKANGWTRDLSGAVRSRVRESLVRAGFARTCSPPSYSRPVARDGDLASGGLAGDPGGGGCLRHDPVTIREIVGMLVAAGALAPGMALVAMLMLLGGLLSRRVAKIMTPLEKLTSLPDPDTFLKPGITLAQLQAEATRLTDNDAAQQLNEARRRLIQSIHHRSKCAA